MCSARHRLAAVRAAIGNCQDRPGEPGGDRAVSSPGSLDADAQREAYALSGLDRGGPGWRAWSSKADCGDEGGPASVAGGCARMAIGAKEDQGQAWRRY